MGAEVWRESATISPGGQVTAYVTSRGLSILKNSSNALSFRPGFEWFAQSRLHRSPTSLQGIVKEIRAKGAANVLVTLNVEGLRFKYASNGSVQYEADEADKGSKQAHAQTLLERVQGIRGGRSIEALTSAATDVTQVGANFDPTIPVMVSERELVAIASSEAVRDVRLATDDKKPAEP